MNQQIAKYENLMNEFIIYRMEEELNLLNNLINNNKKRINNKSKWNLNFIYKSKLDALNKEYEYKKNEFDLFKKNINDKDRIDEKDFNKELDSLFKNDISNIRKYCYFLQVYFIKLYEDTYYEERNREESLRDILLELNLDETVLNFVRKSVRKNIKKVEGKNLLNLFNQVKIKIDGEYFYPFAFKALSFMNEDVSKDISKKGLIEEIVLENKIQFFLPGKKSIKDVTYNELKIHCFMYLLIDDYLSEYSLKNGTLQKIFVSSFLKQKNQYEYSIYEKRDQDSEKDNKISLLNRILQEMTA